MSEADTATTCYRHDDVEAGVRCQRCGRGVCGECVVPAPVGFHCPECVAEASARTRSIAVTLGATPYLTYTLITINVLVALAGIASNSGWFQGELGTIGVNCGLLGGGIDIENGRPVIIGIDQGEWYRIFTGGFLHAGPIHLGFNMFLLWQLGTMLETQLGRVRFGLLYAVSLLGGSLGALLFAPDTITVGASGAVFGLMGGFFILERMGMFGAQRSSVGVLIAINLVLTFAIPGISIGGHLGGLVVGVGVSWLFHEYTRRGLPPTVPISLVLVLSAVLFWGSLWAATFWMDPLL